MGSNPTASATNPLLLLSFPCSGGIVAQFRGVGGSAVAGDREIPSDLAICVDQSLAASSPFGIALGPITGK